MKAITTIVFIVFIVFCAAYAQGFKVKATGEQTFSFNDNRNQAKFFSTTPLEDVTGISNDVKGTVTFNVSDFSTLKGKISISVASLKTGIPTRDGHLQSANWLDAAKYPEISFTIKKVSDIKVLADNKLQTKVTGDFSTHGITKEVVADVTVTYLDESDATKQKAPGDLLGVNAKFNVILSDYDVDNVVVGQKVSENIEITANIFGTNAK
jgi:polyisoprenoid-binding protein YceI